MPMSCSVKLCKSKQIKGGPITFHKFPKDQIRCSQWVKNLGRENFLPSSSSTVCSKHFEANCFDRKKFGGTWLKSTAVPTIFSSSTAIATEADSSLSKDSTMVQDASSSDKKTTVHVTSTIDEESGDSNSDTESSLDKRKDGKLGSKRILKSKRKRISYLGDFKDGVTYTTEELHLGLQIANKLVKQQNKKIKCLKGINSRLRKRVENLDATLEEYKKKVYIPSDVLKEALARNKKMLQKAKISTSAVINNMSAKTNGSPTKTNENCDT